MQVDEGKLSPQKIDVYNSLTIIFPDGDSI